MPICGPGRQEHPRPLGAREPHTDLKVDLRAADPNHRQPLEEVRAALALGSDVPVVGGDARSRESVPTLLLQRTGHAITRARATTAG